MINDALGDAVDHKPDEYFDFPEGYRADYLNCDVLVNRLRVKDGLWTVPEGTSWKVLWVPDEHFLRPSTRAKLAELAGAGGRVVYGGREALKRALASVVPDVRTEPSLGDEPSEDFMWFHRRIGAVDRYFVAAGTNGYRGKVTFRSGGEVSVYDPVSQERRGWANGTELALGPSESVFVEFGVPAPLRVALPSQPVELGAWTLSFEPGWGAPRSVRLDGLRSWTELPGLSDEARAYSGTATYDCAFDAPSGVGEVWLDLGRVETVARVFVNGEPVRTLWCEPYACAVGGRVKPGRNSLRVEVTNTWLNRVLYDFRQPAEKRKTWIPNWATFSPTPAVPAGILGPVRLSCRTE